VDEVRSLRRENARLHESLSVLSLLPSLASRVDSLSLQLSDMRETARSQALSVPAAKEAAVADDSYGPAPSSVVSVFRVWTGSWNLGTMDPCKALGSPPTGELVRRYLAEFAPPSAYDVYVLAVQDAVSEAVFDAFAVHTGCFRVPLYAELVAAALQNGTGGIASLEGLSADAVARIQSGEAQAAPFLRYLLTRPGRALHVS
jgi:hypothetical protein